jgi:hypothetical protein
MTQPSEELSKIPKDERDTKLDNAPKPTESKIERLELPHGAFIAFRKSGGLKFSSREIVIYPDGRVSYGGADTSTDWKSRATRKMNDAQITTVRKILDRTNFFRASSSPGKHEGDAIAYEIHAQLGSRFNSIELFSGMIPESLAPLVELLNKFLPQT